MGLFSFLKTVGAKLSGHDDAPTADALKKELDSYSLGTEDVRVSMDGDKAVLTGAVKDQATYEKAVLAVGNALGVAGVNAENLAVQQGAADAPVFHTVKSGDTLWKIAENYYGKGQGAQNALIFEANRPMLTSPDKIYPGQVLRIPPLR